MNRLTMQAAIAASLTAVSFGLADAANASTLHKTINFEGFGPTVSQIVRDLGNGLTLTVEAFTHSGAAAADAPLAGLSPAKISQRGGDEPGIGVKSGRFDYNRLDPIGGREFLRFSFNKDVNLKHTIFESVQGPTRKFWDNGDAFDLGVDSVDLDIEDTFGTDVLAAFPDAGFPGDTDYKVDFSGGADFAGDGTDDSKPVVGKVFDFYTADWNDSYRIRELKVAVDVPEPAVMLGLSAVAAGLIAQKRSRKEIA